MAEFPEADPGHHALRDRQVVAADREAVDQDGVLNLWECLGERQGRVFPKEPVVVHGEHGQVHVRGDRLDAGLDLVAAAARLEKMGTANDLSASNEALVDLETAIQRLRPALEKLLPIRVS